MHQGHDRLAKIFRRIEPAEKLNPILAEKNYIQRLGWEGVELLFYLRCRSGLADQSSGWCGSAWGQAWLGFIRGSSAG